MPTLLIHVENAGGGARETRGFAPGVIRVGRNRLNDLVLPHPAVSQFHASLHFDGREVTAVAGRATNPLRHNDADLAPGARVPLDGRSALTLGPITLRIEVSPVDLSDPEAAPAWLADRFAWADAVKSDERAPTEGYRPSALRSYLDAMLPQELSGVRPNEDPLAPALAQWAAATDALLRAVRAELTKAPAEQRGGRVHALGVRHPSLRLVPDFMSLAAELGVRWDEDLAELALLRWRQLAFQYGATPPNTAAELDEVVVRLARVLNALADGYAALRGALAPWAMAASSRGLNPAPEHGEGAATLQWLLGGGTTEKLGALRQSFAEMATRPSQLGGAALAGVRALMDRWSPFALEHEMARLRGVSPLDPEGERAVWAHWREVFRWWSTNEHALQDAVFGEAFSRALTGDAGDPWAR
ncbi:MAG: FHA domain-containing protein [Polyangiales bacterium]